MSPPWLSISHTLNNAPCQVLPNKLRSTSKSPSSMAKMGGGGGRDGDSDGGGGSDDDDEDDLEDDDDDSRDNNGRFYGFGAEDSEDEESGVDEVDGVLCARFSVRWSLAST